MAATTNQKLDFDAILADTTTAFDDYDTTTDALIGEDAALPENAARWWQATQTLRKALAEAEKRYEGYVCQQATATTFTVEGIGTLEVKRRGRRTQWDKAALLPAVVARIIDEPATLYDPEAGELLPYAQIAHNVATRLGECVSLGAGKVTGLKAIGLDADEFCHVEWNAGLVIS